MDRFRLTQTIHLVFVFEARGGVHLHDVGLCFMNVLGAPCNFVKQPIGKRPSDHTTKRANENFREFHLISEIYENYKTLARGQTAAPDDQTTN